MYPVFISYARSASTEAAKALRDALPGQCFLDDPEIEVGDIFPERIVDALLGSRVVVLFASEVYFQRRYCLWELRATLGPHDAQPAAGHLNHVVVVLDGIRPDALPLAVQRINWPTAAKVEDAVRLVDERLKASTVTLGQRYEAVGLSADGLLELVAKPPAADLSMVAVHYGLAPVSLQDDFVGRWDDLHRIDFWLRTLRGEPGTAAPIVTVEGFGGQGKTRLAAEYAHRFGPRHFTGGIIWIDASKVLESQFHGVLQAFDASVPDLLAFQQQKRDARTELTKALKDRAAHAPVLWLVDDVPEPEPNKPPPPLLTYCLALGQVAALMTSRRRLSFEAGRRGILLRELESDAAIRLLKREVPSGEQLTPGEWQEIANWVGCLPLALTLLNRVLLAGEAPRSLLETARSRGTTATLDRHMEALRGEVEEGSLRGVTEAMSISYEKLSSASQNAARLLAQLASAPVPMAFLEELPDAFTFEVKSQLTNRSFVIHHGQIGMDLAVLIFGTMHGLMADYLRAGAPTSKDWITACDVLTRILMRAAYAKDQWEVQQLCVPHATQIIRLRSEGAERLTVQLRLAVSTALAELGRHEDALREAEAVVEELERLTKKEPGFEPLLGMALGDYSNRLIKPGRRAEALQVIHEATNVMRRVAAADPDRYEVFLAALLNNVAGCLGEMGQDQEALRAAEESVQVCRRIATRAPGIADPEFATALGSLSHALCERDRFAEALPLCEEAVQLARKLATARPAAFNQLLARVLLDLAQVLHRLGRGMECLKIIEESIGLYERLVRERSGVFEGELASAMSLFSLALGGVGLVEKALAVALNAASAFAHLAAAMPQAFTYDLATTLCNASMFLSDLGDREKAADIGWKAVTILSVLADAEPAVFSVHHARALGNLADYLDDLAKNEEALSITTQALEKYVYLSNARPEMIQFDHVRLLNNLANRLFRMGRLPEAVKAGEEAVARLRAMVKSTSGVFESALASSLMNLAAIHWAAGHEQQAKAAADEAAALSKP